MFVFRKAFRRAAATLLAAGSLASGAALAAPAASPSAVPAGSPSTSPAALEGIEKYTLPNGLEVILQEDHRVPEVTVNLWYHVGAKDEAKGRSGFAHLFEHLMFQGSRHVPEDAFFKMLESEGATNVNGTTNFERTNYYETVPSHRLELALWLESDRMGTLLDHVSQKTLDEQRDVVKNERRQSQENRPYGNEWEVACAALWPESHPYHHTVIGSHEDLSAASLADVQAFFRSFYVPNNATLVLVGDFERAKAKALVERHFGWIPKGAPAPTKRAAMPSVLPGEKRIHMEANVALPKLRIAWPTPAAGTAADAPLELIATAMANGRASALVKKLVIERELAKGVEAYAFGGKLGSTFAVEVMLHKGVDPQRALTEVDAVLDEWRRRGPSAADLERAKAIAEMEEWKELEQGTRRANVFNSCNDTFGDPRCTARRVDAYHAASAADVKDALVRYLPKERRVVIFTKTNPEAPVAGRVVAGGAP